MIKKSDTLAEIDETKYKLSELLRKQSKNELDENEKLVLTKMFFMKTYGIIDTQNKALFVEFYDQYKNKMSVFKQFEKFFGYDQIKKIKMDDVLLSDDEKGKEKIDEDTENNTEGDTEDDFGELEKQWDLILDGKKDAKNKIIVDLLNRLSGNDLKKKTYKPEDITQRIFTGQELDKLLENVVKNSLYFKDEVKNRSIFFRSKKKNKTPMRVISPLFKKSPRKFPKTRDRYITNRPVLLKTIGNLIAPYGIYLGIHKRHKMGSNLYYSYMLCINSDMKEIVDSKYGDYVYLDKYKSLFRKQNTGKKTRT